MDRKDMLRDPLVWKFRMYGFLKNLRFFEPYMLLYLIGAGLSLFQIGLLFSLREAVIYVFEIPSGVLADHWGRKKELLLCFVFYLISFALFFIGRSLPIFAGAVTFFGLGEAFRSGTHKAMIYTYLDHHGVADEKTFLYGRTRAWSLLGSALSALIAVPLALGLPAYRWLFVVAMLPYIGDLALIWSYPDWLDRDENMVEEKSERGFLSFGFRSLRSVMRDRRLMRALLSSSIYDGLFKIIKDYVQPILALVLVGTLAGDGDKALTVWLGLTYCIFHLAGSAASASIWRLRRRISSAWLMNASFDVMGMAALLLAGVSLWGSPLTVAAVFFLLYVMKDARRPIFVDLCGDLMDRDVRATVMSVDSQLRSFLAVIAAPLLGWVADGTGLPVAFAMVGLFMLASNRWLKVQSREIAVIPEIESSEGGRKKSEE
ncbi:MFS transporter [Dethiosulfovibrio sp. F2B]|uniref:MFS transporter n=1 Tax=Dethiosulfovibrio faecalis TaxID=2720018 RepID=UPI001F46C3F1|nr:MFS transporter [Dethiosulfovibrio faecalis]MCF4151849.1 MFS transporter [Dethiosulfovibrio faecalis]